MRVHAYGVGASLCVQASVSKRMSVSEGLSVCYLSVCVWRLCWRKTDVSPSMNEAKNHRHGNVNVIAISTIVTRSKARVARIQYTC